MKQVYPSFSPLSTLSSAAPALSAGGQAGAAAAPAPAGGLGNNTESAAKSGYRDLGSANYAIKRRLRYDMKDQAGRILGAGSRVSSCMRVAAKGIGGSTQSPGISRNSSGTAHFHGVGACGSVWTCPVCAVKVQEQRRLEIIEAMRKHRESGGICALVTFTVSHHKHQKLDDLLPPLLDSLRGWKSLRAVKDARSSLAYSGSIRCLEVRHSPVNGWHPHVHEIWFLDKSFSVDQVKTVRDSLAASWVKYLGKKGLSALDRVGFDLQVRTGDGIEAAGAYVAKWGHELAYSNSKLGKRGSRSPWQILESCTVAWNVKDHNLFAEYAQAFEGRSQLYWSPGLKKRFGLVDLDDAEVSDMPESEQVYEFSPLEWRVVSRFKLHAQVLTIAELSPHKLGPFIEQFVNLEFEQQRMKRETARKIQASTAAWMARHGIGF